MKAKEHMQPKLKYYHPIYEAIGKHLYVLPLTATTVVGGLSFGWLGALGGLTLGAIDLAASYYGYYQEPYLTSAILGMGVAGSWKMPYHLNHAIGFAVGALVPTGMVKKHIDKVPTPASSAVFGYIYGGRTGAAIGLSLGIIDESMGRYCKAERPADSWLNKFHLDTVLDGYCYCTQGKPYLSNILREVAIADLLLPAVPGALNYLPKRLGVLRDVFLTVTRSLTASAFTKGAIGGVIGVLETCLASEEQKKSSVLELMEKGEEFYSDLMSKEEAETLVKYQTVALVFTQLIVINLKLKTASSWQKIMDILPSFKNGSGKGQDKWTTFLSLLIPYGLGSILQFSSWTINHLINEFFGNVWKRTLVDRLDERYMSGENILKFTQRKDLNDTDIEPDTLQEKMGSDVNAFVSGISQLPANALSNIIEGTYGIGYLLLHTTAKNMILYSVFYNQMVGVITCSLANKIASFQAEMDKVGTEEINWRKYVRDNKALVQRNEMATAYNKLLDVKSRLRKIKDEQTMWESLNRAWSISRSVADFVFSTASSIYEVHVGRLDFDNRMQVNTMSRDISQMIGWEHARVGQFLLIEQAMKRLNQFKAILASVNEDESKMVTRVYGHGTGQAICFDDFFVGAGDKTFIEMKDLCIDDGTTAITGDSESGKSTLLNVLRGLEHTSAWGSGTISIITDSGDVPKIEMTAQHYDLPPAMMLLELMTWQLQDEAEQRIDFIKSLMMEMQLDKFIPELYETKDWKQHLTSGGARQKIEAIRLILKQPDIALLDEFFVGLDPGSIVKLQEAFNKYLPTTQFIVVDHHAANNNYNGFYNHGLHLANKTLAARELPVVEYVEEIVVVEEGNGEVCIDESAATELKESECDMGVVGDTSSHQNI